MIAYADKKEQERPTPDGSQEFNWRNCWYPVTFLQDMPSDRPLGFSIYDEPLVLFRDKEGKFGCASDRCPHRAAKLSDGQIIDGKLECLYHGWQFNAEGKCLHVPQLPPDAKIPAKACLESFLTVERQGILWVWLGEREAADIERIPTLEVLEKPGVAYRDFILDLPYDRSYLVENVLDPAHLHVSHDGTQGDRKRAQPLEIEIIESSQQKILAKWRGTQNPQEAWKSLEFIAPNLVHSLIEIEAKGWFLGLIFYSLPWGKNRCRMLFRSYSNFAKWEINLRPRWLNHLRLNKILEEDLPLLRGQQQQIEQLEKSLKEIYLPLKTADPLVVEYRKWLDKYGASLPFYEGYSTSKRPLASSENEPPVLQTRFERHTQICSSCNRARMTAIRLKQISVGIAIALFGAGIAIGEPSSLKWGIAIAAVAAAGLAAIADKFKTKFERSYERHPHF